MRSPRRRRLSKERRPNRHSRSSYGSRRKAFTRRQPLDSFQTIGISNKVWQTGFHSVLKMRPSQRVIKSSEGTTGGGERHTDSLLLLFTGWETREWPSLRFVRRPYTQPRSSSLDGIVDRRAASFAGLQLASTVRYICAIYRRVWSFFQLYRNNFSTPIKGTKQGRTNSKNNLYYNKVDQVKARFMHVTLFQWPSVYFMWKK